MKSNSLLLTCEVLFRFLPFFLDTAIQIWNAIEVDRLALACKREQEQQIVVNGSYNWIRIVKNTSIYQLFL